MPERGTLSIDKAKKLINYEPKWKIEDGYQKYIDWYKNFESKKLMSFKKLIKKNTFIVAEIGNNHEGNFKTAIELIDKASEAKVDAVKFQSYDTQSYLSAEIDKARIKKLDKFSLDFNQFKELSLYAKKKIFFFNTI